MMQLCIQVTLTGSQQALVFPAISKVVAVPEAGPFLID